METDDYLLDDLERSQLDATQRRRSLRSRRYHRLVFATLGFVALVVLAAPSIISQTGIARSLFTSTALSYGWTAEAESISVGWITPLSISNVTLTGASGDTILEIEQVDTALTVSALVRFDASEIGDLSLRGVSLHATVGPDASSIESDLEKFFETESDSDSLVRASVHLHDVSATITDQVDGKSWVLDQSNMNLEIDGRHLHGDLAGVVHEPSGHGGAIQSLLEWTPDQGLDATDVADRQSRTWELSIETDSFPLSITHLISRRFGESLGSFAQSFSGDTTGKFTFTGMSDGTVQAALGDVRIRNLQTASDGAAPASVASPSSQWKNAQWNNALATLDGQVSFSENWLISRGLEVTTDFASATLDGSFPTTISLVGSEDNPLRWLQALDGRAELDVDLAALDRAMPGLIPLRDNATLVSGRARGLIENSSAAESSSDPAARRSQLTLQSNSLRARSAGRVVVIDPMKLTATVSDQSGSITAERFDLTSAFASASGSGSLQGGTAEVNIDFGRLYTMLRPIIDLSELSLGGSAGGDVKWTVNPSGPGGKGRWDLTGSGEAKNLLVTLPSGYRFKRSVVQCDLNAIGQWDGRTLHELSSAHVAVRSGGISMSADLTSPVVRPTADAPFPVRIETDGRLENLNESLRPWLPTDLVVAQGRITGSVIAKISRSKGSITKADFVLSQPQFNYANRWYGQPRLQLKFDGVFDWPSSNFHSQETTIVGQDLSLAIRGDSGREHTHLDVAWDADLAGLQNSVGSTIARAAAKPSVRPISFRPVRHETYHVEGDSKGKVTITDQPDGSWKLDCSASASGFVLHAPAEQQIVPPGTPRVAFPRISQGEFGQGQDLGSQNLNTRPVWEEPRIKLEGPIVFNPKQNQFALPGMNVACDWFAGNLVGDVNVSGQEWAANFKGPSRLQMETLSQRLTKVLGTTVRASGIHEAPVSVQMTYSPLGSFTAIAKGELGWDACEIAGVQLGKATLPLRITERDLRIARTKLPLLANNRALGGSATEVGNAVFAAAVDYGSTPTTIRIEPGSRIDSLQITPETAAGWLKYLAPLAADATSLDGVLSVDFDKADIVIGNPDATNIQGNLNIRSMRLASGPLVNQMIQGVRQVKSLVELAGGVADPTPPKTLVEMPPQNVEFSFVNSVATHQRMYFQIDRAQIVTSGRVSTNSQIDMVALVPLDARWLGSDLQGLAGQTLTFPITGTLSQPRLDDSAVRNVMTQLGTKATTEVIQSRLDGLLQKQFGSGMEQINSGLEKILGF